MLKIVAIGNLTNDVELKVHEATGKPYAILRIASDRRYRDKEGNRLTDFISIKVRGPLAERCAEFACVIQALNTPVRNAPPPFYRNWRNCSPLSAGSSLPRWRRTSCKTAAMRPSLSMRIWSS